MVKSRLRDYQRKCRARHRDFVNDLKRRLAEYERSGVQATLEMQQAARAVEQTNRRLRQLLALHGVSDNEVDRFLRSDPAAAESQYSTPKPAAVSIRLCHSSRKGIVDWCS